MDKITACGAVDRGPIPRGGTIGEFANLNKLAYNLILSKENS